jgi:uncharacterized membrane protein YraQ (UPF0718 family)
MDFADLMWWTGPVGSFGKSPTILGFNRRHMSYYVAFPYWVPTLICIGLATAPFLIGHQSFRFSLRTLLIATTVVAVVLGLVVWRNRD